MKYERKNGSGKIRSRGDKSKSSPRTSNTSLRNNNSESYWIIKFLEFYDKNQEWLDSIFGLYYYLLFLYLYKKYLNNEKYK